MWTKDFWKATAERVIATFFQAILGTGILVTATKQEWWYALTSSLLIAFFALCKCIIASRVGNDGPSLTSIESVN